MSENREYKSDTFSMLLEYPENALQVYNALNHSHYENAGDIQMIFIEMVRTNLANPDYANCAVKKAIDDCIKEHILEEFFIERRNEVEKMMTIDCTWERREKLIRKEEHEDGYNEGYDTGYDAGYDTGVAEFIRYLLREGKNDDEILEITKCSEQELINIKETL